MHVVERLECPAGHGKCRLPAASEYQVTARPFITFGGNVVHGGEHSASALANDEAAAIYRMVEKAYNDKEAKYANGSAAPARSVKFAPLSGAVSTADLGDAYFEVDEGDWAALRWGAYHVYSSGVLGGCSNETLNGKAAEVAAPYSGPKQNATQTRFLDGSWSKSSNKIGNNDTKQEEEDPDSGAAMIAMGPFSWSIIGFGVLAMGIVM
ncbi:hypothetical protein PG997_014814 [Apiospora hydei]|uniref:Uncharacterized protein n=1 Tax=Apiospora hydei TaxID=1337664 RepID=A0ABR1UUX3_9PEZI